MARHTEPKPMLVENYLLFAKASVGTPAFRRLYFRIGDKKVDVLRDGDLSCAFFVSGILTMSGLLGVTHTTVKHTVRDLKRRGWKPIKSPVVGSIIVWAPKKFKSGETHRHIGFYLGGGKAVSNSSKKRSPRVHAWNFRPVEEILWNKSLAQK